MENNGRHFRIRSRGGIFLFQDRQMCDECFCTEQRKRAKLQKKKTGWQTGPSQILNNKVRKRRKSGDVGLERNKDTRVFLSV